LVAADLFDVAILIDQVLRILFRDCLAFDLNRIAVNRDRSLGHAVIGSFAAYVLTLFNDGKLAGSANGFHLVPGERQIPRHVAMKSNCAVGFTQELSCELIAICQDKHIRRRGALTQRW
jgi:hypothetical protein